ncbi:MAG: hypothetical protein QOJ98_2312 [Acidobacteriota bacterium]|jgi:predicted DNA-binding transcriptional regulator AlpA|nr:hypothetical protein [Acidobacteriota bacterium]
MNPTNLDLRALAEVLADVLVERGLVTSSADAGGRVLDAAAVAHLLGRERQWVYDHANELGAFRYGDGPRARLGFDLQSIEQWKTERQQLRAPSSRVRRRTTARSGAVALIPYEGSGRGA